ncbi:MAG: FHA domain-containing protein [Acidobacteriota bacterium]
MSKLVVFRGDAVEHEVPLTGKTVTIGRDSHNDIVLDDSLKGVSRFHAEVRAEGGKYVIVDLKSRNGVWVNKRRIAEKADLPLGVAATLGAYELVLEDDASSGEFSVVTVPTQHTLVNQPVDTAQSSRLTTTRASSSPRVSGTAAKGRGRLPVWSGIAVAVLLISAATFALVRSRGPRTTQVVDGDLPTSPPDPARLPVPKDIEDPRKRAFREHLAEARKQMDDHDYRGAVRDHLAPVLDVIAQLAVAGAEVDFDTENGEVIELKKQAEAGRAPSPAPPPPPPGPPPPDCGERSGISRRLNEPCADYERRAQGMIVNFQEGRRYVDIPDYPNALARFRLVDGAQKGYMGVDTLITETIEKQRKALENALNGGQQNEQAGNLRDARTWYQTAVAVDPNSIAARDRLASLLTRMKAEASKLYTTASATWKLSNKDARSRESAVRQFQQVVELTLPGDEIRIEADKKLEEIKR